MKKLLCRACVAFGIPFLISLAGMISPSLTLEAEARRAFRHLWEA